MGRMEIRQRLIWCMAWCTALALVCLACGVAPPPEASSERSETELRQHVGMYVWGRVPDLTGACSDAKRLGAGHAIRIFMGPWSDTPPYEDDLRPLREKAASPGYVTIFNNFEVVMITAYDSYSYAREYPELARQDGARDHPSDPYYQVVKSLVAMNRAEAQQYLDEVKQEFRDLAFELSKRGGTFILSNWEAEHDVPDAVLWPVFAQLLQARMDGIIEGRTAAAQQGHPAKVFTAFEFTIIPGFEGRASGLADIGSKLRGLDYLSYSAWWSIGSDFDADRMEESFLHAIRVIREFAAQQAMPTKVIIGEFGEYWNLHPGAERLKSIVDVSIKEDVEYIFNWVLYEQPGEKDEHGRDASHFGKYSLDRRLTRQGEAFQEWLGGTGEGACIPAAAASAPSAP